GTAGVSRVQARFDGSERQARGRLMAALNEGAVLAADTAAVMAHRAASRLVHDLCAEGLVRRDGEWLVLP
ncbi:MAG: A/G-specific adenine glycosylase, partial [Actinomycetota bacterium]